MAIKTFEEKASVILGVDSTYPGKVDNFYAHLKSFSEVLPELVRESNLKIGGRNLKAVFLQTDTLADYDPFLRWRISEFNRITGLFRASDNESARLKFSALEEKFTENPDISKIKKEIFLEGGDVKESLIISKSFWGRIEEHDFFDEIVTRFSGIFSGLSSMDLSFLSYYISVDEFGVIFLFQKFFYACLKCKLASQLILALYKPGAFVLFFDKVAKLLWWRLDVIKASIPFVVSRTSVIRIVGFSGVGLGLTLFSNFFVKPVRAIQSPIYTGFTGDLGFIFNNFRLYSSMLIFECAQTISHITNAGIAGFLVPKEEALRSFIRNLIK